MMFCVIFMFKTNWLNYVSNKYKRTREIRCFQFAQKCCLGKCNDNITYLLFDSIRSSMR